MAKNPRTDKKYLWQKYLEHRAAQKQKPKKSKSYIETPPLNDDGSEWGDYAYTASDF